MQADIKKWAKRAALALGLLVLYVVTAVPVGLFIYTLKSDMGWDVFRHTGYHGFLSCLAREGGKIEGI